MNVPDLPGCRFHSGFSGKIRTDEVLGEPPKMAREPRALHRGSHCRDRRGFSISTVPAQFSFLSGTLSAGFAE
jgi:hypothetical protein